MSEIKTTIEELLDSKTAMINKLIAEKMDLEIRNHEREASVARLTKKHMASMSIAHDALSRIATQSTNGMSPHEYAKVAIEKLERSTMGFR